MNNYYSNSEMYVLSEILMRRKGKILAPWYYDGFYNEILESITSKTINETIENCADNEKIYMVFTVYKNMKDCGFRLSSKTINFLLSIDKEAISKWYTEVLRPVIEHYIGSDVTHKVMYPNFPTQVIETDQLNLLYNALVQYYSNPPESTVECEKEERPELDRLDKLEVLDITDFDELIDLFYNIVTAKVTMSPTDYADIENIAKILGGREEFLNRFRKYGFEIPNKANLVYATSVLKDIVGFEELFQFYKTVTDVLRFAYEDDPTLKSNVKLHISRPKSRLILRLLNSHISDDNALEDIYRYRERWLRVAERLHLNEKFANRRYPDVCTTFNRLRNNKHKTDVNVYCYAYRINDMCNRYKTIPTSQFIRDLVYIAKERPGEFARNLDRFLTLTHNSEVDSEIIISGFEEIADKVATNILIQMYQHFTNRVEEANKKFRTFIPNCNTAKVKIVDNKKPALTKKVCIYVCLICVKALRTILIKKPKLGKVYIDSDFKNFIVPFSLKNASKTTKSIIRGSRISIPKEVNYIRSFIWWTNNLNDRVDIDLSLSLYNENFEFLRKISFTSLKDSFGCHSGDITNGGDISGDGVSEFIDLNIDKVLEVGARYAAFTIHSYTGQKFSELKNCRFGWMNRKGCNDGEIFEPSTVEMLFDIDTNTTQCIPVMFDCKEKQFIWTDMTYSSSFAYSTVEGGINKISELIKAIVNMYKERPNLYDLILFNTIARGELVFTPEEADIVFSNNQLPFDNSDNHVKVITAYETDYYISNMM